MYKNIRIVNLPNKTEALIALRSVIVSISPDDASDIVNSAPGVVMRGVWTPYAKQISEALKKTGAEVVLE